MEKPPPLWVTSPAPGQGPCWGLGGEAGACWSFAGGSPGGGWLGSPLPWGTASRGTAGSAGWVRGAASLLEPTRKMMSVLCGLHKKLPGMEFAGCLCYSRGCGRKRGWRISRQVPRGERGGSSPPSISDPSPPTKHL